MTVKELMNELHQHIDSEILWYYLDEQLTDYNIKEYEDELVENFVISALDHFAIEIYIY